ncbi:MAG: YwiC-like family protein [Ignavibacteria bacterium]|nr:YwiC-like family protein [Ignavibacteria bacterium]
MIIPKPIIPKEHGSWAVLLVPLVVGANVSGIASPSFVFLSFSVIATFLAYLPIEMVLRSKLGISSGSEEHQAARFWSIAYLSAGLLFVLPLLLEGYWALAAIGVLAAISFLVRFFLGIGRTRNVGSDLVAVAGLTLTAPSAYYVLTKTLDGHAITLWLLNFLFFGSGVVYVHMKMKAKAMGKIRLGWLERISIGKLNLIYHVVVVAAVLVLASLHLTQTAAILAFVPMIIHAVLGTVRLSQNVRFKTLGFLLLAQSIVFAICLTLTAGGRG